MSLLAIISAEPGRAGTRHPAAAAGVVGAAVPGAMGLPVVYQSSSSGDWGLAEIGIRGGEFTCTVQLYRTERDAMAAVRHEPGYVSRCFATVTSVGVTYEKGQVELVYKISDAEEGYAPRSGMLTLSPLSTTAMKGFCKSDIMGAEANRGVLNLWRPAADGRSESATA